MTAPTAPRIRRARESAGLTQREAGALIGRALRTWQAYESGDRALSPELWELWTIRLERLQAAKRPPP